MTYTELVAAIQSYTENQFPTTYLADGSGVDSTTQIDTFIKQAEQRIYNSIQFPSLRKNVTGVTVANNKYVSAPSDFLAVYSLAVIDGVTGGAFILHVVVKLDIPVTFNAPYNDVVVFTNVAQSCSFEGKADLVFRLKAQREELC